MLFLQKDPYLGVEQKVLQPPLRGDPGERRRSPRHYDRRTLLDEHHDVPHSDDGNGGRWLFFTAHIAVVLFIIRPHCAVPFWPEPVQKN